MGVHENSSPSWVSSQNTSMDIKNNPGLGFPPASGMTLLGNFRWVLAAFFCWFVLVFLTAVVIPCKHGANEPVFAWNGHWGKEI